MNIVIDKNSLIGLVPCNLQGSVHVGRKRENFAYPVEVADDLIES